VRFTHAFTPIPICGPARHCLLYGNWPTDHLGITNPDTETPRGADEGLPTWSAALRAAGYRLGYVGKWHMSAPRTPLDFGFHAYVPEGAYAAWRKEQGISPPPRTNGWFGEADPYITPEQSRLAWGANETIRLLEAEAERGEPFFVRWDPSEPHLPCVVPEPYASLYPPGDISPWPSFPDPLVGKPYIQAQMRRTWGVDGWTWADWQPVVARYLGTIALLDAQVGRVLDALDRLGLAENTLVIYTCDHGDTCGGHGMIDKHYILYDDVVQVPMLARWPGGASGVVSDAFVTHALDLAATFCDAAGAPTTEGFRGESLVPLLTGKTRTNGRDAAFGQYMGNQFGLYSERMVRDRRWKYVWNATAEDELYDLDTDPGEIVNRAADPAYGNELYRLRARLVEWMEQIGDPLCNHWTRPMLLEGRTI
jgi:arylsulfatase A-like enzyme